ncbi:MAG TPA: alanine--glyoxylate aminotransferase family protein, partial [Burkholderiaceae bacterium]|nr:alanine--glyoxylate aminotransferase family protein [Burkholderiaceae bacterium]
ALARTRDVMLETREYGFDKVRDEQWALGRAARTMLEGRGFPSVAADGFQAPGVVVSFTTDPELASAKKLVPQGLQIAAGVPLQCDEGPEFRTFRVGLFGLDKLHDVPRCVGVLERAFAQI